MESKLIKLPNIWRNMSNWEWAINLNHEKAKEKMYQVALKYKEYKNEFAVINNDIILVEMCSANSKFNRTLKLNVGLGMFDKELEADFIGKELNQTYYFMHSTGEIKYTIKDITRMIVPVIDDKIAQNEKIAGVSSAKDLYNHFILENFKEELYYQINDFLTKFHELCDFAISESDLAYLEEKELKRCREIAQQLGLVFEEMTSEQLGAAVGVSSIPEFREEIRKIFSTQIKNALIGALIVDKNVQEISLDHLDNYISVVRNCISTYVLEKAKMEVNKK
ncbi:MAG TPA: hypothetical protein VIK84_05615 [Haloplasmataceae bacterium]